MLKLLLVFFAAVFAQELTQRLGAVRQCYQNQLYELSYDVHSLADHSFVDLEQVSGLKQVTCDIDSTRFLLDFASTGAMGSFLNGIVPYTTFVTSFGKFAECVPDDSLLLHRVISAQQTSTNRQIELVAVPARYDEVIENGTVSLNRVGACQSNDFVCLGVNTDASCAHAAQNIPILQNQYLNIDCQNCFLGFHTEVFFSMKITLWKLTLLTGGLRNIGIDAGVVLDLKSNAQWSAVVDRNFDVVKQLVVLKFNIGVIPVRIWFELPVEVKATAIVQEGAHAQIGATARLNIGDAYVQWTPDKRWQVVKPKPAFSWSPVLMGDANFHGHVDFAIIPTLKMHIDNLFNFDITLAPTLHLDVVGGAHVKPPSANICADLSYDATIVSNAELKIDIPWLFVHTDKTWGPTSIMDTGVQPIAHKCAATR